MFPVFSGYEVEQGLTLSLIYLWRILSIAYCSVPCFTFHSMNCTRTEANEKKLKPSTSMCSSITQEIDRISKIMERISVVVDEKVAKLYEIHIIATCGVAVGGDM